jgi:hypothetical protein
LSHEADPLALRHRPSMSLASLVKDIGLIACLALLAIIPLGAYRLAASADQGLTASAEQAQSLASSLTDVAASLRTASKLMDNAAISIDAVDRTLRDSTPVIDHVSAMLSGQTPDALEASRQAMLAAQTGAQAMDTVLRGLALLGGPPYDPEHSLSSSLGAVASDLEPLPETLRSAGANLSSTGSDLEAWRQTLPALTVHLQSLSAEMRSAADNAGQKAESLAALSQALISAANAVPVLIGLLGLISWLALLGLTILQIELRRTGRQAAGAWAGG